MKPLTSIDFTRNPYKGIFAEIAAETGRSRQAVRQLFYLHNADVMRRVHAKVTERQALLKAVGHAR